VIETKAISKNLLTLHTRQINDLLTDKVIMVIIFIVITHMAVLCRLQTGAERCCTNCLPSSTTPTSLNRPTEGSPLVRVDYKIAVLLKSRRTSTTLDFTCLSSAYKTVECPEVIYVRPTVKFNTVFINKHCCSSVLMLRPHRLEQSSLICTHCWQIH